MVDVPHANPLDTLTSDALRRHPCAKWRHYDDDVLALWVADMDFPVAEAIQDAVVRHTRDHPFMYPPEKGVPGLREAVAERLERRFGWSTDPDQVRLLPGIVPGIHLGVQAFAGPGDGVLTPVPVYPPFLHAVETAGRQLQAVPLAETDAGFRLDLDALAAAVTPATRLLLLCHPNNPTGRVFDRGELEALAELALEHRLWVVSDELHADLSLSANPVPFASLSPEIARRTVTLYGPTKAFNIAGLKVGFAHSANDALLRRFTAVGRGLVPRPNVLAQVAAKAALSESDAWLDATLDYLRGNLGVVRKAVERLPGVRFHPPEATYLAWLDFRTTPFAEKPAEALLERVRVALSEGTDYGEPGRGFARLNFAAPRPLLIEALARIEGALCDPAPA